jgi:predicted transcriptional regulator
MTQSTAAPATGSTENTPETAVPNALNTTGSKLVYLHITTNREVTIDEIQDDLQMKKITLYSVLGTLKDNGLIEQNGDVYSEQTIAATASD